MVREGKDWDYPIVTFPVGVESIINPANLWVRVRMKIRYI